MSKDLFTDKEIKILSNNKYVKSVSMNGITFTDEFRLVFITEHEKGKIPSRIFQECGFDISIVGLKRIKAASHRWRTKYKNSGIDGIRDTRKGNSGRSRTKELTLEEKSLK
ncbi:HTH domain-containing protein [Anaerobacillus isosaccharinicus]|uniref:HTH domain-containing protein n=1 Tax=Anaerobacillus isosaccharinicus TaxID=1532552 RepID=A0A7S7RAV5_9BACI|nr:HTH domain-containing protein [Anaerobacillus isosaccharinicus]MBA5586532.1 hypothetical protein [Anaerobacillus isosaccharinicus]QOY35227.1 hypothetical protein AWH56_021420 [Anaerobacillus isosaccharinicus]